MSVRELGEDLVPHRVKMSLKLTFEGRVDGRGAKWLLIYLSNHVLHVFESTSAHIILQRIVLLACILGVNGVLLRSVVHLWLLFDTLAYVCQ